MSSLPENLDRRLGEPCPRCERAYPWRECLPGYFTGEAFQDIAVIRELLDRWEAEAPEACRPGRETTLRLWGATRRGRGWE
jgi:hypothetical protein